MFIYRRASAAGLRAQQVRRLASTAVPRQIKPSTTTFTPATSDDKDGAATDTPQHTPIKISKSGWKTVSAGAAAAPEAPQRAPEPSGDKAETRETLAAKIERLNAELVKAKGDSARLKAVEEEGPESLSKEDDPAKDEDLLEAVKAVDAELSAAKELEHPDLFHVIESGSLKADDVPVRAVTAPRDAQVARLAHDLNRVLFSPGVHYLRDPRTGVWNFPRDLGRIPTPEEFAFHRLPQYITASEDPELAEMAQGDGLRFTGSTSTLTSSLSQIYFTLSGDKGVDISQLSQEFAEKRNEYTAGAQLPASLVVRLLPNGRYAVDNNKEHSIEENILSDYGRILEKHLTADSKDFTRFLNKSPESAVPESERTEREAYCYSRGQMLLMRSQLDCQDIRLPGNGTFDIKTRACSPLRNDRANYKQHMQYDISEAHGMNHSFEREYYDLTRSGMLKYCFQARIGQMDGIFVAYHNTARYFGFQYLPLGEIDKRLFGSTEMASQVFTLSVAILERILDQASKLYPNQTFNLNMHRQKKRRGNDKEMIIVVQPTEWDPSGPRPSRALTLKIEHELDGEPYTEKVFTFSSDPEIRKKHKWVLKYTLSVTPDDYEGYSIAHSHISKQIASITAMNSLYLPDGMTAWQMKREIVRKRKAEEARLAEEQGEKDAAASSTASVSVSAPDADEEDPFNLTGNAITAEEVAEVAAVEAAVNAEAVTAAATPGSKPQSPTIRWMQPNERIAELRTMSLASGVEYNERRKAWPDVSKASYYWMSESQSQQAGERMAKRASQIGEERKVARREARREERRKKAVARAEGRKAQADAEAGTATAAEGLHAAETEAEAAVDAEADSNDAAPKRHHNKNGGRKGRKVNRLNEWKNGAPLGAPRESWKDRKGQEGEKKDAEVKDQ